MIIIIGYIISLTDVFASIGNVIKEIYGLFIEIVRLL